jgi:two-component system, NtrC family, sensor kinase
VRRHGIASRKTVKTRRRKNAKAKPAGVPSPAWRADSSPVDLQEKLRRQARELEEAREEQAAAADVLRIISSSPGELEPVFQAILEKATRLCEAKLGNLWLRESDRFRIVAIHGGSQEYRDYLFDEPLVLPDEQSVMARIATNRETVHVDDISTAPTYGMRMRIATIEIAKAHTLLGLPMLKDQEVVGIIAIYRQEVRAFTDKQIELVKNFAAQAVIAIQNARLFNEVQAKTRDLTEALTYQTGSSNILSVIASSPTDVGPVLKAIVESACELCEANDAIVALKDGDDLLFQEQHGSIPVVWERRPINRKWTPGRAVVDCKPVHVHDLSAEGEEFPEGQEIARRDHVRTVLSVPLLRENESIGAILLRRTEVQPFSDKQIALLQTFTDQAVIAIGNVRLFEQVQERTRELSLSLDNLRTAQDRLIQTEKLASLGQLTAGIAHEIKNPLNFVNNFSALSAELVGEMNDVVAKATLDTTTRGELDELTQMLKSNLEKVVLHGKRADSIVKNMLLHSREGSGEHRSADINAIVDESLNLAYHGARAEKAGFSVAFQRYLDPSVGMADVYPQEITRVLLNLISNGFYATTKRKADVGDGFEPVISATTKNLGDKVEIRIRDNGTGIPEGVKEKIFNPFFTTKPSGEGTGLGLSMSHDIIVKQHGGSIDVETEPGLFTEFKIVLPRTSQR